MKFKESRVEYKKMIAPFDFKLLPKTKIPELPVFDLMREFTQSALYFRTLERYQIDQSDFNIEFLDRDLLNKANNILDQIVLVRNKEKSVSSKYPPDEKSMEESNKNYQEFQELSNKLFELIPRKRFNDSVKIKKFKIIFNIIY